MSMGGSSSQGQGSIDPGLLAGITQSMDAQKQQQGADSTGQQNARLAQANAQTLGQGSGTLGQPPPSSQIQQPDPYGAANDAMARSQGYNKAGGGSGSGSGSGIMSILGGGGSSGAGGFI